LGWKKAGAAVIALVIDAGARIKVGASTPSIATKAVLAGLIAYTLLAILEYLWKVTYVPVTYNRQYGETVTALRKDLEIQTGWRRVLGTNASRKDDLLVWIPDYVRKTRQEHGWLRHVTPPEVDYREYVDALREWAGNEIQIVDEDQAKGDVKFKIRQRWFEM